MRRVLAGAMAAVLAVSAAAAPPPAADFAAAVHDPIRPAADIARDADRKPAEVMAFARVRPGETVVELAPGGGYFTRLLAGAVGPRGHVYAVSGRASPTLDQLAAQRPNLTVTVAAPGTIPVPEPVDLVWTTLNYHDFKNVKLASGGDAANAYDAAAFKALKPGGLFLVIDHDTAPGMGATQTSTLHRIERSVVVREVEAAGFQLLASSDLLRHPEDDHTVKVVETGIRGKTDQFALLFRKPD